MTSVKSVAALAVLTPFAITAYALLRRGLIFPNPAQRMFQSNRPSFTAEFVCIYRAIGSRLGYFDDAFAYQFCDWDAKLFILTFVLVSKIFGKKAIQSRSVLMMLVRTRGFDQFIDSSNCSQVVILGAGLDSRAYRLKNLPTGTKFFEVDAPATQLMKREKVESIFHNKPELFVNGAYQEKRVTFVSCNFAKESFVDKLEQNGFDKKNPKTVILMEGVAMYLEWEELRSTLMKVSENCASGTLFALHSMDNAHSLRSSSASYLKNVAGEPWKFSMKEGDTAETLFAPLGFEILESLSFAEAFRKYVPDSQAVIKRKSSRFIFMRVL